MFWYTPEDKKEEISESLLVETILSYGDIETIKQMFRLVGIKRVAHIFRNQKERKKLNYSPEIYNFFKLFFERYA